MDFAAHADLARALAAAAGPGAGGSLAIVEAALLPGDATPVHLHETPEAFYVVEGVLGVFAGGEEIELEAGESVVAPRGVAHALRAPAGPVRYLSGSLVRSASRYEDFLRAVASPLPDARGWTESEDSFRLAALGAANGISLLGAPLPS
jgi:quercetin dioxygenase-like cupin family protein